MIYVLSHRNAFRGVFLKRNLLYDAIRGILGYFDNSFESELLIRCPDGQIKFDKDGTEDHFCKFNFHVLFQKLKERKRVSIFDKSGEDYLFAVWEAEENVIFHSLEESSVPIEEETEVQKTEQQEEVSSVLFGG